MPCLTPSSRARVPEQAGACFLYLRRPMSTLLRARRGIHDGDDDADRYIGSSEDVDPLAPSLSDMTSNQTEAPSSSTSSPGILHDRTAPDDKTYSSMPLEDADTASSNPSRTPLAERLKGFAAGTASGLTKLTIGHPFELSPLVLAGRPPSLHFSDLADWF